MEYDITVHEVESLPDGKFRVGIFDKETGTSISEHTARVTEPYVTELGFTAKRVTELIRVSFQFLLERESPNSILKEFDLQVISTYFPEYKETMLQW